jgi:hypothetical protein
MRDITVSGMATVVGLAGLAPRLAGKYMEPTTFDSQLTDIPVTTDRKEDPYEPVEHDGGERGRTWKGWTKSWSLYTTAVLHEAVREPAGLRGTFVVAGADELPAG